MKKNFKNPAITTHKRYLVFGVLAFFSIFLLKSSFFCSKAAALCSHPSTTQTVSQQIAPSYFTYSESSLQQSLSQNKRVVLYFYAPWCTSCTNFDEELKQKSQTIPQDVVIFQVPYDTATELKNKYQVSYQHTLILLDSKGQTKEMWIGGDLKSVLEYLSH